MKLAVATALVIALVLCSTARAQVPPDPPGATEVGCAGACLLFDYRILMAEWDKPRTTTWSESNRCLSCNRERYDLEIRKFPLGGVAHAESLYVAGASEPRSLTWQLSQSGLFYSAVRWCWEYDDPNAHDIPGHLGETLVCSDWTTSIDNEAEDGPTANDMVLLTVPAATGGGID